MKKNILVLTIIIFLAFNNLIAQIIPGDSIWDDLIPNFKYATIIKFDTITSSDYIVLLGHVVQTNNNKKFLRHKLGLLYGDITRVVYTVPRKYANSSIKNEFLQFGKLGYKPNHGGGQVIGFELYLRYSRFMFNDYMPDFTRTKNSKLNSYNNFKQDLSTQTLANFEENQYLCNYSMYTKKCQGKNIYVVFAQGIIKGTEYLFFVDLIKEKEKPEKTPSINIEKMIVELYNNNKININDILFDTGKSTITKSSEKIIEIIAQYLTLYPDVTLQINGYTDNVGSENQNLELSEQRAIAVVNSLVEDYGISRTRLTPQGFGEEKPIAENTTEEGRKLNRRVELVVDE